MKSTWPKLERPKTDNHQTDENLFLPKIINSDVATRYSANWEGQSGSPQSRNQSQKAVLSAH
jgi:hypothetical protein